MKVKNEEEKSENVFYLAKIFQFVFFWNFELRLFQVCIQIFYIFLRLKVPVLRSGFLPIFDHFQRAITLDRRKIRRYEKYEYIFKSAKLKVSEKYKLKYFSQVEKIFISFFFIFHFRMLSKFLKAFILQIRVFNEAILLILSFFLQGELTKMCENRDDVLQGSFSQ